MSSHVFGVVAPHPPIMVEAVGAKRSRVTHKSAEALMAAASLLGAFNPDTIVLMSPHSPPLHDAFVVDGAVHFAGTLAQFGAAESGHNAAGDPDLAHAILAQLKARGVPASGRDAVPSLVTGDLDHGALVPLHFLDPTGRWPLVLLSLSWLDYGAHRELGRAVAAAAASLGRRIAFVASGDCSHRLTPDAPAGFDPLGVEFDRQLVDLLEHSDFGGLSEIDPVLIEAAGECGLRSFIALGGAAEPAQVRVLAYEGPWGVGYLTAVVNEELATPTAGAKGGMPGQKESEIVALARRTIELHIRKGENHTRPQLHDRTLPHTAGAFVSLHREGELRGCIGTIEPTRPTLAEEVARNAIQAATQDPRFPPLHADELGDLDLSVDVLHEPEPATIEQLDPKRYGVIVMSGYKRGLLLPDLDGVDSADQQIAIARRKAGIGSNDKIRLMRFKVDRFV